MTSSETRNYFASAFVVLSTSITILATAINLPRIERLFGGNPWACEFALVFTGLSLIFAGIYIANYKNRTNLGLLLYLNGACFIALSIYAYLVQWF